MANQSSSQIDDIVEGATPSQGLSYFEPPASLELPSLLLTWKGVSTRFIVRRTMPNGLHINTRLKPSLDKASPVGVEVVDGDDVADAGDHAYSR